MMSKPKQHVLSKKPPRHIKLSKIKKQDHKDNLRPIDITSRDCQEIVSTVKRTFLSANFDPGWELKSVAFVENRDLEEQYRQKRAEMKEESKHAVGDNYAFLALRDASLATSIAKEGLKCKMNSQSSLGDSKLGVYVCRNADVQLKQADTWKVQTCTLVIFKVLLGKCKSLAQLPGDYNIEPTPNFDCHIPQVQANPSDMLSIQLKRSQIYLYEYTEDCEPSSRPRQVLPYAVLTYEKQNTTQPQVAVADSYSKRPALVSKESDPPKSSVTKPVPPPNNRDPRLGPTEDDIRQEQIDELGRCVPHLSAAPPVSLVADLGDPRSQLSFLAAVTSQSMYGPSGYKPSFGPGEGKPENDDAIDPQRTPTSEPPSSLPPIQLPDPRVLPVAGPRDPRLSQTEPVKRTLLPDPHPRLLNPRLAYQQQPVDPRIQQDPRLQRMPHNQQMLPVDPRVLVRPGFYNYADNAESVKTRKKLSLSDYKKKVNITTKQEQVPESSFEMVQEQSYSGKLPPVVRTPSPELQDDLLTHADLSIIKAPLLQKSASDSNIEHQPKSPESRPRRNEANLNAEFDDIVEEPHDMMKTLNELSDPDDASLSPKDMTQAPDELPDCSISSKSPKINEELAIEDPVLAGAMQKLIEHSANVTLFTEALRSLQESAEEFGEQLTDPEFLVKKIAEKIEALSAEPTKKETSDTTAKNEATESRALEIQEIDSPVGIMSPDRSNDSKSDADTQMKTIPLESVDCFSEVDMELESDSDSKSPRGRRESPRIDVAVQKTLNEYKKVEQSDKGSRNTQQKGSRSKHREEMETLDVDLRSIPVPPEHITRMPQALPRGTNAKPAKPSTALGKGRFASLHDQPKELSDDEVEVSQILPSLQEKKKPVIAINLQYKKKSNNSGEHGDDVDLRLKGMDVDSKHEDGFGLLTKGLQKVRDAESYKQAVRVNEEQRKKKAKKEIDMFETEEEDVDHRNLLAGNNAARNPFGLGSVDVDERIQPAQKKGPNNEETSSVHDEDWRSSSKHVTDIDLRSADSSRENSQGADLGDFDFRKSHSRSASPPGSKTDVQRLEVGGDSVLKVRKFVDPFGLDEDTDDRILPSSSAVDISRTKELAAESTSQESNSDPGVLFDAYALRKSSTDPMLHANEYGDIDWRQAAAAEMGDYDMRMSVAAPSQALSAMPTSQTLISAAQTRDPFKLMNQNLQNMFIFNPNLSHLSQYQSPPTAGSATGSPVKHSQQAPATAVSQGDFNSVMQNLDFSNLKNILATVQQPGTTVLPREKSQEKGEASGQAGKLLLEENVQEQPKVRIPGFDVTPEKNHEIVTASTVSETLSSPSKSGASLSKGSENKPEVSVTPTVTTAKASDSLLSTPRDKIRKDSEDMIMTPLPNISYQTALLESMEQSALKVRHDDSLCLDSEESPIIGKTKKKSKLEEVDEEIETKRLKGEIVDKESSSKQSEENEDLSKFDDVEEENGALCIAVSDESDDDEVGLVIDLSPSEKSSKSDKITSPLPDDVEMVEDDENVTASNTIDLTEDVEPVLMIDEDSCGETKPSTEELSEEQVKTQTKDELKHLIESSRKNMVIKLKGETKLINPQTGKTYNDTVKGSAIEVVGKGRSAKSKNIEDGKVDFTASPLIDKPVAVKPETINSMSGESGKPANTAASLLTTTFQSQTTVQQVDSFPKSAVSTASPPTALTQPQRFPNTHQFVHPLTGQTIAYGQPTVFQPLPCLPGMNGNPLIAHPFQRPLLPTMVVPHQPLPITTPPLTSSVSRAPLMPPGLSPQLIGQPLQMSAQVPSSPADRPQTTSHDSSHAASKSKDVMHWFSDKFQKRETRKDRSDFQKPVTESDKDSDAKNAESVKKFLEDLNSKDRLKREPVSRDSKSPVKISKKDDKFLTESTDEKPKADITALKRPLEEDSDKSPKKLKYESDVKRPASDFGSRILEAFSEVKSKQQSPQKSSPEKKVTENRVVELKSDIRIIKEEVKQEKMESAVDENKESGEESELEDGEISDSMSESEESVGQNDQRRVQESARGSSISVIGASGSWSYDRGSSYSSWRQESPRRIINVRDTTSSRHPESSEMAKPRSAYKIGADWADILQNPEVRSVERVKATKIESPSLRNQGNNNDNLSSTDALLSKSAAVISKSRQKYKAQCHVKTLGEWLKLELEIDDIEPLNHIIPYPLDTDLTKIPKPRKRKIRTKVKNLIEQEGLRSGNFTKPEVVDDDVVIVDEEKPKPLNLNYLPEVSYDETERELQLLGKSLNLLKEKVRQEAIISNFNTENVPGQFAVQTVSGSTLDKSMIVAMTLVESEMKTHMSRTCFYGYPHRRIPSELLLNSELGGFKSETGDVFLILMMPLSVKPYNKLLHMKTTLQNLYQRRRQQKDEAEVAKIDEDVKNLHLQRQAVLHGFTGYLNKKRISKLQDIVEKYTMVYEYFKSKSPPTPDSMLKYIRTTQVDLRQHLILAKQYLALEEQKSR